MHYTVWGSLLHMRCWPDSGQQHARSCWISGRQRACVCNACMSVARMYATPAYGQLSKSQSGKIGPDPGSFELLKVKGQFELNISNVSGSWDPPIEILRLEIARADFTNLTRREVHVTWFTGWSNKQCNNLNFNISLDTNIITTRFKWNTDHAADKPLFLLLFEM